jgi:protein TonB
MVMPHIRKPEVLVAGAGSLLIHAVPLAIVLAAPANTFGLGREASDSTSLEAITTITVEAIPVEASQASEAPPPATIEQAAAVPTPPVPVPEEPAREPEPPIIDPPVVEPLPQPKTAEAKAEPSEIVAVPAEAQPAELERLKPAETPAVEEPRALERPKEAARKPPPMSPVAARSASSERAGPTDGAKGASKPNAARGDLIAYAALVRNRLAERKPSGRGRKGTVAIAFAIDRMGKVGQTSVHSSSGHAELDKAALTAVAAAGPLPPPPDGRDHSFVLPFHFR